MCSVAPKRRSEGAHRADGLTSYFLTYDAWNGRPMRWIIQIRSAVTAERSNSHTVAARQLTALRRLLAGRCTNGLRASCASAGRGLGQPYDKSDRTASSRRTLQLPAVPQPQGHALGSYAHTL